MASSELDIQNEKKRLANVLAAFALALTDKVNDAIRDNGGRSGMSSATLIQIGFNPGLSIERLRSLIGLTHSATVRVIDQLAGEGMVRRERNTEGDTRVASLVLTDKGVTEMQTALVSRSLVAEPVVECFTALEMDSLASMLEKAIPNVVGFGANQDVVCRLCDMRACPQDRCPVNTCVIDAAKAA
jgi:MarR family transcriptional regulator, negative regulator of the multidrug operon emrRAB